MRKVLTRGKNNRGILLSFVTRKEAPAPDHRTAKCPKRDDLELEYQHTVDEISSVVMTRFPTLCKKIQELHKWQDGRDRALGAFYEHKASHIRRIA